MAVKTLPAVATKHHDFCKKCDCDRYHVVLTHPTASSAKLECEVCKKKSTLKLESKAALLRRLGGVKKKTVASNQNPFEEMKGKISHESPQAYSMKGTFRADSAIDHPKFGLGFVVAAHASSIEVAFEAGTKQLLHNRTP